MKRLEYVHIVLVVTLSLLMLSSLLMATYVGRPASAQYNFDAFRGVEIPDGSIDGVIRNEWDDAGHYTGVALDASVPRTAELWTKHDETNLYIAMIFTPDSNNAWTCIMLTPDVTACMGQDAAIFGDDNLNATGYTDAWFVTQLSVPPDTRPPLPGHQDGAGAMLVGEGNLTTIELKKPLRSGDDPSLDIAWSVGGTYELVIAWDSDGKGNILRAGSPPGGSNGGYARHEVTPTRRSIYINPNTKPGILFPTVTANPSIVTSGNTSTITVRVMDSVTPVSNATVTLSSDSGGSFSSVSGITDSNGYFSSNFTAPNVPEQTNVKITATASKSGHTDRSAYKELAVLPPGIIPFYVAVATNPSTIKSGENSTIAVNVTDLFNFPVPDATVTLSSDSGGNFAPGSGYTDSNGTFTSTFTTSVTQNTTITITANATKEGYFGNPNQTELTVQSLVVGKDKGIDWPLILIAVAVASVVVITAAVLIVRRGRKGKFYAKMHKLYEEARSAP